MTPERHARIKEVFLAVCGAQAAERPELLEELCAGDLDLRQEVEKLLQYQTLPPAVDPSSLTHKSGTPVPIRQLNASEATASAEDPGDTESGSRNYPPGMVISRRYRVICLLGQGGMGEVYRADDLTLGKQVALKFLPRRFARDSGRIERMRNEVRMAHRVTHPHVCRVYDLGRARDDYFISMEYIDGEDLHRLLRRIGRLPYEKGVQIAAEICSGLAAAHAKGILHRDLKPANIMIDGRGHARISDFGLAALWDQVSPTEIRAGTPDYMSPEQLAGRQVSVRSDIYALGLILYEIFTGETALRARTAGDSTRDEKARPLPLSDILERRDPELVGTILKCLDSDPQQRPASVSEVCTALPGGDPLAAALAAGETLSPDMIAAASEVKVDRVFFEKHRVAVLLGLLAAVVALAPVSHPLQRGGFTTGPQVLAEQAHRITARLGLPPAQDEAFGLEPLLDSGSPALGQAARHVLVAAHPERNPAVFWYRCSQQTLLPSDPVRVVFGGARVSSSDPVTGVPGDCEVILDSNKRLLLFDAYPRSPAAGGAGEDQERADWSNLLALAGLKEQDLSGTEPALLIDLPFDRRAAWASVDPQTSRPIRVETAWRAGQAVFFAVLDRDESPLKEARLGSFAWRRNLLWWSEMVLVSCLVIISLPLARTNLRRGRSDLRGALRLGMFILVIRVIGWLFQSSHASSLSREWLLALLMLSGALAEAGLVWLLYLALEPYVRRLWPQAIVSWTRVLAGRLLDERVGRDVFLGCILGTFFALLFQLDPALTSLLGLALRSPVRGADWFVPLGGTATALAFCCDVLRQSVYFSLAFMLLVVLLRTLIGHATAASLCAVILLSVVFVPRGANIWISLVLIGVICVGTCVWAFSRLGLLPIVVALFLAIVLLRFPLTFNPRLWYSDFSLLTLLLTAVLAGGSFLLSRHRQHSAAR